MGWGLYDVKMNAMGETDRERYLNYAKEDFLREAVRNPAYNKAKRNEMDQEFLITRTEVPEKYKVVTFPGEDINVGDYIDVFGERFLVIQVRIQDTLQKNAIMWLCNHEFKWQSGTPRIISRWGVLDSGVYSSTIRGEVTARTKDKQFKVYLPFDEETRKMFVDKRLAIDRMYDRFGNTVLNVYNVTGFDSVSESFRRDGHLLVLNLREGEYDRERDNPEYYICDYIPPESEPEETELLKCEIAGTDYIRLGTSRKYRSVFYDAQGNSIDTVTPQWSWSTLPDGVSISSDGADIVISAANDKNLTGRNITITLADDDEAYEPVDLDVRIISL